MAIQPLRVGEGGTAAGEQEELPLFALASGQLFFPPILFSLGLPWWRQTCPILLHGWHQGQRPEQGEPGRFTPHSFKSPVSDY